MNCLDCEILYENKPQLERIGDKFECERCKKVFELVEVEDD